MARSKFRTHYGRPRNHPMVTRRAIRHHGFLTEFHRPVTGGRMPPKRRHRAARYHVVVRRSAHAGHLIKQKTRAVKAQRQRTIKTAPKLSHTKIAGRRRVVTTHRKGGIHTQRPVAQHGQRHMSPEARRHLSEALKGKRHPHRGHAMSAATRAKISAAVSKRLRGRPHPHKGHVMSNEARAKISKALKGRKRR